MYPWRKPKREWDDPLKLGCIINNWKEEQLFLPHHKKNLFPSTWLSEIMLPLPFTFFFFYLFFVSVFRLVEVLSLEWLKYCYRYRFSLFLSFFLCYRSDMAVFSISKLALHSQVGQSRSKLSQCPTPNAQSRRPSPYRSFTPKLARPAQNYPNAQRRHPSPCRSFTPKLPQRPTTQRPTTQCPNNPMPNVDALAPIARSFTAFVSFKGRRWLSKFSHYFVESGNKRLAGEKFGDTD